MSSDPEMLRYLPTTDPPAEVAVPARRPLRSWLLLWLVWVIGLAVWAVYIAVIVVLLVRFIA